MMTGALASRCAAWLLLALTLGSCGGGSSSESSFPPAPQGWSQVTDTVPWGTRDAGSVAAHNGALWVLGGWNYANGATQVYTDAWSTLDGSHWTRTTPPWTFGMYTLATSFQGRLLLMAGLKNSRLPNEELSNEIWGTEDGESWSLLRAHADWEPRIGSALVQHQGALWLLGGKVRNSGDPSVFRSDVWRSTDGTAWASVTTSAAWQPRAFHCALSHNGRLWVLGGGDWDSRIGHADVWSSADGANWQQHPTPPWEGRIWHGCVSYAGLMWVMGGRLFDPIRTMDEIWTSPDGDHWTQLSPNVRPDSRHAAYVTVHADRIWVMGGSADGYLQDDVWQYSAR
jgi:hypothetical protein